MEMCYWEVAPETQFIHIFSKEENDNRDTRNKETWLLLKTKNKKPAHLQEHRFERKISLKS